MPQQEVGPGRPVCRGLVVTFVAGPLSTGSGCCPLLTASPEAYLVGKFSWDDKIKRAATQMKCTEALPRLCYTLLMMATPTTTTSLCSNSPRQSNSQIISGLFVWQPAAVCSTMARIAGSQAGAQSRKESHLLKLYNKWRFQFWETDSVTV
ncbi:hypothetical protein LDENG_00295810 [Lucifuga dentata]|nr:hypothetical protein LDENG_00295810 [Lucifuga dentata]